MRVKIKNDDVYQISIGMHNVHLNSLILNDWGIVSIVFSSLALVCFIYNLLCKIREKKYLSTITQALPLILILSLLACFLSSNKIHENGENPSTIGWLFKVVNDGTAEYTIGGKIVVALIYLTFIVSLLCLIIEKKYINLNFLKHKKNNSDNSQQIQQEK